MEQDGQQRINEDLRQELEAVSRALYSVASTVRRLPGADETMARGAADNIAILSWRIDVLVANDDTAAIVA